MMKYNKLYRTKNKNIQVNKEFFLLNLESSQNKKHKFFPFPRSDVLENLNLDKKSV